MQTSTKRSIKLNPSKSARNTNLSKYRDSNISNSQSNIKHSVVENNSQEQLVEDIVAFGNTSIDMHDSMINQGLLNQTACIDKFSCTGPLPEIHHKKLHARVEKRKHKYNNFNESKSRDPNYRHSLIFVTSGGATLYIAYDPINKSNNYVKTELNFSKADTQDKLEIQTFLIDLFGSKFQSIFLNEKARVTKVEFALDFVGIAVRQVVISFKRSRSFMHLRDNSSTACYKRTGSQSSDNIKAYDKAAEIKAHPERNRNILDYYNGDIGSIPTITRVEITKKVNNGINPNNVSETDLGLDRVEVYGPEFSRSLGVEIFYMIDALGLSETLKQLPLDKAKNLKYLLEKHPPILTKEKIEKIFKLKLAGVEVFFRSIKPK